MRGDRPRRRGHGRTGPLYCTDCGEPLEPSVNYCPNCGATAVRSSGRSRSASTSRSGSESRPRTDTSRDTERTTDRTATGTTDRNRLEYRIAAASREGWQLEHDFGDHAVMIRRTFGGVDDHLLVALITVWWTMGMGNVLYGAYRYFDDAERMVVRAEQVHSNESDDATAASKLRPRATAVVGWLLATMTIALGVQLGLSAVSLILVALGLILAVAGTSVLPSVSRRLEARHSVLTNGRTHTVDERTVVAPETPCAACAGPIDRGLERTYRAEFCVLGVPVTATDGRNYYCRQCANAESAATGATDRTAIMEPTVDESSTGSRPDQEPESEQP
ncbi:zinc ribbon domain-containing protein [Natrinema sp. SYSU A 869]|uniref:zinc ribbon domain-containing protein n=1 Tax=Natrinema sp. SYSU A 869 TaxID=2871694 RepID=UPI001CA3B4CC|nr:zinc ribbon domain-containing protein [Natrinema sp. SYSU A 869]